MKNILTNTNSILFSLIKYNITEYYIKNKLL